MKSDLNDVAVFNEVVASGSLSAAGRRLGLPPSAVSRRLARLEERLGVRLVHRTTRKLGLTDEGRIYHEQTGGISRALDRAERALAEMSADPRGVVRVTTPPDDSAVMWPVFEEFLERYPEVGLDLIQVGRYVDLVDEGVDVAVRSGPPPDSTQLSARKLVESRMLLVASPTYLERRGTPQTPADLADHDCLVADWASPQPTWSLRGADGRVDRIPVSGRVRVTGLGIAWRAALAHHGIAVGIDVYCAQHLARGSLVEVLPGAMGGRGPVWAISPVRRHRSPAVRAMVDHLAEAFPRILGQILDGVEPPPSP